MTTRLLRDQVAAHVTALQRTSTLTGLQTVRLTGLVGILDDDGRFLLRDALDAGEFTGSDARAQDAFQDFRQRVNAAAATAGVELALQLDAHKLPPDRRHGWFTGGELIDEGIATFTAKAARQTDVTHPVAQSVADLTRATVYVSYSAADARVATEVLRELTATLKLDGTRTWHVASSDVVRIGEDDDAVREQVRADADVRIALVSPRYLTDPSTEPGRVLAGPEPVVAVALIGLPDAPLAGVLRQHDILRRHAPWVGLTSAKARRVYVDELADALRRAVDPRRAASFTAGTSDAPLALWSSHTATRRRAGESEWVVPDAEAAETSFLESHLARGARSPGTPAVARLLAWAGDPDGPQLCALLGDVGMGKTTTAKLFTRALLARREVDPTLPLPILFDLRDARTADITASMTTEAILGSMLDAGRPASVGRERLSPEVVLRRVDQGDTVVVFDGLDEVLIHLGPEDRQHFTRRLWRTVDPDSGSRLLVTCRSQYFRTIRDETTYFGTEGRDGRRGERYLALLMLPFHDWQVSDYLMANLGQDAAWVERFLETIACVHDLTDLSRRPVTLRMIADQVDVIESAKFAGREVAAVDLYREFVDRWLVRDEEKRVLEREHKHLLMEEIAAGLWRSGDNAWGPGQIDAWLLDVLDRRPDLQRRYRHRVPELLTADFRTATFLSREGDQFSFGHRSLAEYFLACYLCRALVDGDRAADAWAMAVPSEETLDFLGQLVAGLPAQERGAAMSALRRITSRYRRLTSELALAYALSANRLGQPRHSLVGVHLAGAQLEGWRIGPADPSAATPLAMTGANLAGAALRGARFDHVDLSGADLSGVDLTRAELHRCRLVDVTLARAQVVGTVMRDCAVDGLERGDSHARRAALLHCAPPPAPAPGWRVGPSAEGVPRPARLVALAGHTGRVVSVGWSPDGTRLATAGDDGPAYVWDAATGHPLAVLTDHSGAVRSVAWSPDGTRLATAGDDRTVRLWDTDTAHPVHVLTGHTDRVDAVAWSPDGTRLATAGDDRAVRLWDTDTAHSLHTLTRHGSGVRSLAWSPDSTRLATASADQAVRVWDATTARLLHVLSRATARGNAVAWSADGGRLATGGDDATLRVWDAATTHLLRTLAGHTAHLNAVAWSPDSTLVATTSDDGSVRVWDTTATRPVLTITGHSAGLRSVAWSPDSRRLTTTSADMSHRVWDATTARPPHVPATVVDRRESVVWSSLGSLRAGRFPDHGIFEPRRARTGIATTQLSWLLNNAALETADTGPSVLFRDRGVGRHLPVDWPEMHLVPSPSWTGTSAGRVIGSKSRSLQAWFSADGGDDWAWPVSWSPDGSSRLATGDVTGVVRVWDFTAQRSLQTLTGYALGSVDVRRSIGGPCPAVADDRAARHRDPTTCLVHVLRGHTSAVRSVAWSPDGTRVATTGDDGTIRQWDPFTGRPTGLRITLLPDDEIAVFDAATETLIGASDGAWRWLGWQVMVDGRLETLPAETYGPLPPLDHPRTTSPPA